jgi:hypothetical protein
VKESRENNYRAQAPGVSSREHPPPHGYFQAYFRKVTV